MVLPVPSETRVILLPLLGCHVFETVAIDCASDEPCARPKDADADTDTDADTDADTDTDTDTDADTGPLVEPSMGWAISGEAGGGNRVMVYGPDGVTLAAWTSLGDLAGAVAYDPAAGVAYVGNADGLYRLAADGSVGQGPTEIRDVRDVAAADSGVYAAVGTNVVAWRPSTGSYEFAVDESESDAVSALAPRAGGGVLVLDTTGGSPDVYRWTVGSSVARLAEDFDDSASRALVVFAGPDDAPHTCSAAGGVYSVERLAAGEARPVAYYSGGLTDVSACAYDPGDGSWLLFSPSVGVIRMDADSRAEVAFAVPTSYTPVRASFFAN
jgi:hypothetical protein